MAHYAGPMERISLPTRCIAQFPLRSSQAYSLRNLSVGLAGFRGALCAISATSNLATCRLLSEAVSPIAGSAATVSNRDNLDAVSRRPKDDHERKPPQYDAV